MGIKIKEIKEKDFSVLEQTKYASRLEVLQHTLLTKGKIYGAFENEELIGFCAIERERFGSKKQYVKLAAFQIKPEKQDTDVKKQLFDTACSVAASFNAGKLYIPSEVAEEHKEYLKTKGCKRAEEAVFGDGQVIDGEADFKGSDIVNEEDENVENYIYSLECETGLRQNNGMMFGMCIGMCLGVPFGLTIFKNVGVGMCFGMAIGMCIGLAGGSGLDWKNQKKKEKKEEE